MLNNNRNIFNKIQLIILLGIIISCADHSIDELKIAFKNPPENSKPGVYWYFMDGNLSRLEMTKDLESMKEAGIGHVIFLEVGIGVPRGPVDFMSEEWQQLFVHAVREAERLGIKILLGAGPGWCGSGGPWVKPEESMQHLVFSETEVKGGRNIDTVLKIPEQRSTPWHNMKNNFYKDVAVYAVPSNLKPVIDDINEKALYERYPYSSYPNVKTHIPEYLNTNRNGNDKIVEPTDIINITKYLKDDNHLVWNVPKGNWSIIRMGIRVTGASTRPSPEPAIGLECNKLQAKAFENHLKNYTDILLEKTAPRKKQVGWTGFHIDSWESGSQNWTDGIEKEFIKRRGYDPEPFLLCYTGRAVGSIEITERFLWDLRKTCQELLIENHAEFAKAYANKNGLELSIEPYDMNPAGDLDLGAVADVIMAEFWSKRFGYDTHYAVIEAASIAHVTGKPIIGAEVFTSDNKELWQEYPWSMKDQSDWALSLGVNRFMFHTFAHKPLGDKYRPGMTMGPYGVHWDRGQTWWPMVGAYHKYISRCSYMMQQGQSVADILYLTPEGAPMIFIPPPDALKENGSIPDQKGYRFDGCSPNMLIDKAKVENGKIKFPGTSSYEIMVMPNFKTMTPQLLKKIISHVEDGATIIGSPPIKSPSLSNYPECDNQIKSLSKQLWGTLIIPDKISKRTYGKGKIFWGGDLSIIKSDILYPTYKNTVNILKQLNINEDFTSKNNSIRFAHKKTEDIDIFFVSNRTDSLQNTECTFRATGEPELWIGTTGEIRKISEFTVKDGKTTIPIQFYPYESFFVIFSNQKAVNENSKIKNKNFPSFSKIMPLEGPWDVSFDAKLGGPEKIKFDSLFDWTDFKDSGIKFYSGIAKYRKSFNLSIDTKNKKKVFLDLGIVNDIAKVKLNGKDIGVIWCAPWRIEISEVIISGENEIEIEVANRWVNRLLGDKQPKDANVRKVKFGNGFLGGKEYLTGRYTFTIEEAMKSFNFEKPLPSGLFGPVTIQETKK